VRIEHIAPRALGDPRTELVVLAGELAHDHPRNVARLAPAWE
jgi:hypothetical protein